MGAASFLYFREYSVDKHKNVTATPSHAGTRKSWTPPVVRDLPLLADLTLQSAGGAPASGDAITVSGGSGGLVF